MKKHFCTRCLKHFMEQRSLQQHALYCTNEDKPDNLINALRVTGGYSKEVRKANIKKCDDTCKGLKKKKVRPYKS